MSEDKENERPEIVSEFPAPPAFFALYKDGKDAGPAPPEPMTPTYHMFGTPYSTEDIVPDLLPQEGKKVYLGAKMPTDEPANNEEDLSRNVDYKAEMKKINRSLLANFIELVDILIKKPSIFNQKLDDLELLFLNMHNLINSFRPHQARENIIQMLQTQTRERQEAAQDIRRTIDESRNAVEAVHAELHGFGEEANQNHGDILMQEMKEDDGLLGVISNGIGVNSPRSAQIEKSVKSREAHAEQEKIFVQLNAIMNSS